MSQLALPLKLDDHAVFESFYPTGNEALLGALDDLRQGGRGPGCFLWGASATGKTHLLQATCAATGDTSVYLPLSDLGPADTGILEGLESRQFICLDDIDTVSGDDGWEHALFALLNQATDAGSVIIVSSKAAPRESGFKLPDLVSRLARLAVYHLAVLGDDDRSRALQMRARHRGLDLPDDTANFLLTRSKRYMASLYALLDQLDDESLAAKRRLTIPFVKDVLGN